MWAPVALLLMVVATAVGSLGGDAGPEPATIKSGDLKLESAGFLLPLEAEKEPQATPASMSPATVQVAEAAAATVSSQASMVSTAALAPLAAREVLATEDPVFRAADLAVLDRAVESNPVDVLLDEQMLDGVVGSPQMFSTSLHRALTKSGDVGVEAGLQLPLFDDRPGFPVPELVVGIRVRF